MTTVTSDQSRSEGYPRKRARTRRQLVNAGMVVLADKGPDGATVGEVARTARVASGTFYNHFPSMTDLVEAVTGELASGVQIGRDTLDEIAHDPAQRVLLGTEQLLDLAHDDPRAAQAFVSLLASVPTFRSRVRSIVSSAIDDGMKSGRFATNGLGATTDALLGAVVQWMRSVLSDEIDPDVSRSNQLAIVLALVGVPPTELASIIEGRQRRAAQTPN